MYDTHILMKAKRCICRVSIYPSTLTILSPICIHLAVVTELIDLGES